jgi:quercetin dioxygenase-like cupin family protein
MSATLAAPKNATALRFDLYTAIHKALRLFMNDTLGRVGQLDHDDAVQFGATLAQLQSLLDACRSHVAKENKFVHPAIEARCPGASERIGDEHAEHLDAIAALEAEAAALRALPSAGAALRLYRQLARFVGENFLHMHVEESAHNSALWASYSDAELLEIHQRILASIDPAEMALMLRWMVPALTPGERAAMLGEMQMQIPPEAMRCMLEVVRPHLDDSAWAKLARALRIPAAAAQTAHPFVVQPESYPAALNVLGARITVLASNSATRSHEVTVQQGDEGVGPPPHCHPWDETFFVTRGRVTFACAGQTTQTREGTLVHVPAGTVHAFRFGPGGGSMLEIAGAGGAACAMFSHVADQFPAGAPAAADVPRLIGVLQQHGVAVAEAP